MTQSGEYTAADSQQHKRNTIFVTRARTPLFTAQTLPTQRVTSLNHVASSVKWKVFGFCFFLAETKIASFCTFTKQVFYKWV